MPHGDRLERTLRELAQDGPYRVEAYEFVFEALDYAFLRFRGRSARGRGRHLSVRELLEGVREYAWEEFGPLATAVFEWMGIHRTDDIGDLVFRLADAGLLRVRREDRKEDFHDAYSFEEAFALSALDVGPVGP